MPSDCAVQGGISPPGGGPAVSTDGGDYSAVVGGISIALLLLATAAIQQYNHRQNGLHMLKTWEFYFDWVFACLVGVTVLGS